MHSEWASWSLPCTLAAFEGQREGFSFKQLSWTLLCLSGVMLATGDLNLATRVLIVILIIRLNVAKSSAMAIHRNEHGPHNKGPQRRVFSQRDFTMEEREVLKKKKKITIHFFFYSGATGKPLRTQMKYKYVNCLIYQRICTSVQTSL